MPITRTPMIDDDGSGTTGTIINNAWKQELYNQIDAYVQSWVATPFNAAQFGAVAPMTWTVTAGQVTANWYLIVGRVLFWNLSIEASTVGGTPTSVLVATLPGAVVGAAKAWGQGRIYQAAAGWREADLVVNAGESVLRVSRADGTTLTVDGTTYVHLQVMVAF